MRVWLTGMTNEGNENDLRDLIEPIKNDFHGLIFESTIWENKCGWEAGETIDTELE